MNLQAYLSLKAKRKEDEPGHRAFCPKCRLAYVVCDCRLLKPIDPKIQFVILIHPEEVRRRIATGRLSHFLLKNSLLLEGEEFESSREISRLIDDPLNGCVVLYPGKDSVNLSDISADERQALLPAEKKLVVFVIDGTWRTAKKMLRLSPKLQRLPTVCFSPPRLSQFRIRKQPTEFCFSTLEAIHHVIELLGPTYGFAIENRPHDHLLEMFDRMVQRQIDYQCAYSQARLEPKS